VDLICNLNQVFENKLTSQQQIEAIQQTLNRVHFVASEWVEHAHFSEHNYIRMLLTLNENFSLMLLCWNPNQKCNMHSHDHAPNNTMFVKTLSGSIKICRYSDMTASNMISETELDSDSKCLAINNKDIGWHLTGNFSQQQTALSLHLYTPPMLECKHSQGVSPVIYCEKAESLRESKEKCVLWLDGGFEAVENAANSKLHACVSVFSNFQSLMEMLRSVFEGPDLGEGKLAEAVGRVVEKFEFNPKEVEQYKSLSSSFFLAEEL